MTRAKLGYLPSRNAERKRTTKPMKRAQPAPAPNIAYIQQPRCKFCGVDGHLIKDCKLKRASDHELAQELKRRIQMGLDPLTGRRPL